MGWLRDRLEAGLGLGLADEPRRVGVEAKSKRLDLQVTTTPGARVRVSRDKRDGDTQRFLLWCLRRNIAVELVEGPPAVYLDGQLRSVQEARAALTRA